MSRRALWWLLYGYQLLTMAATVLAATVSPFLAGVVAGCGYALGGATGCLIGQPRALKDSEDKS